MAKPSIKLSRAKTIALIKKAGKEQMFLQVYGRTPEDYFAEYSYKEPDIWISVLNDLQVKV